MDIYYFSVQLAQRVEPSCCLLRYFNLVKIVIRRPKRSWENIKTNLKEKESGHIAESSDLPPSLVACWSKSGAEHVSWKGRNAEQKEPPTFQAERAVQLT